jgi:hypothetical protein
VLVVAAACAYPPVSAVSHDAADDGPPDAVRCFGTFVRICFSSAGAVPVAPKMLGNIAIDTDASGTGSSCDQQNDQKSRYCVVAAAGLTVASGAVVTAQGSKPLVLLSTSTLDMLGDIDVSSHHAGSQLVGAGANPSEPCSFATSPTTATSAGGGYGGSFGSRGGDGSAIPGSSVGAGLAGSASSGFPTVLRGGCRGGDGAVSDGPSASGGSGGGAVGVIAMQVRINGKINASGGGGRGAPVSQSGGGGGGSGGMIFVDSQIAPSFGAKAKLWANGGSGAQAGIPVSPGIDGSESIAPDVAAPGTNQTSGGSNGGDGSLGAGPGKNGLDDGSIASGGSGGGGGAGFIHAPGLTGAALISPPSSAP